LLCRNSLESSLVYRVTDCRLKGGDEFTMNFTILTENLGELPRSHHVRTSEDAYPRESTASIAAAVCSPIDGFQWL
jgi:hypothetical protein